MARARAHTAALRISGRLSSELQADTAGVAADVRFAIFIVYGKSIILMRRLGCIVGQIPQRPHRKNAYFSALCWPPRHCAEEFHVVDECDTHKRTRAGHSSSPRVLVRVCVRVLCCRLWRALGLTLVHIWEKASVI